MHASQETRRGAAASGIGEVPELCLPTVYIDDTRPGIELPRQGAATTEPNTSGHSGRPFIMFMKELRQAGHVRRFIIRESAGDGWEVREEQDSKVVRQVQIRDWHRVERARMRIDEQVSELEDSGWR